MDMPHHCASCDYFFGMNEKQGACKKPAHAQFSSPVIKTGDQSCVDLRIRGVSVFTQETPPERRTVKKYRPTCETCRYFQKKTSHSLQGICQYEKSPGVELMAFSVDVACHKYIEFPTSL